MDNAQLLNIEPKPNVFEFSLFEGLAVVGVGLLCERFTIGDMCKMSVDEAQILMTNGARGRWGKDNLIMWLTKKFVIGNVRQTEYGLQLLAELGDAGNIRGIEFARHSELLIQSDCLLV